MLNTIMSSNVDNKKIISYFENVGAKLSYSTGKESLSITIRTLNDIDQALVLTNIINKALRTDKLDSNTLKLEKDKILRAIEDSEKRPASLLSSSISAKLFLNSGLAHQVIGDKDSVDKITDIQIINHVKKVFNLEDIEVNIVGDITESNSKKLISSITNKLSTNRTLKVSDYKMQSSDYHTEFDSTQSHLAIIIPAIKREDPDYHNILVANYIFGGNNENIQMKMTSPVLYNMSNKSSFSFVMPKEFEINNCFFHEMDIFRVVIGNSWKEYDIIYFKYHITPFLTRIIHIYFVWRRRRE